MRTVTAALLALAATLLTAGCVAGEGSAGHGHGQLRLDFAYYNPESLVIRDQHWLDTALKPKGVTVIWVQSAGSNKANANLRAGAVDIGSTAGTPALLARANGSPIKTIDVYSQPEWSAIVVTKNSPITSVAQLKGHKVAATIGTDPYFFLLQALRTAGLSASDVQVVNLQHADGKTALERGDVDAWAGLDPYMAQTQLQAGSRLIYRNLAFNSYGFLNATETFLRDHADLARTVVDAYERARAWIEQHPDAATKILASAAKISPDVARLQLQRTRLTVDPVPGAAEHAVLAGIVPLLVSQHLVTSQTAADTALDSLFEPKFADAARR